MLKAYRESLSADAAGMLADVVDAITKRIRGCKIPVAKRDKKRSRLPKGSCYVKEWDGREWTIYLTIATDTPGEVHFFETKCPRSFQGEELADNLYRKWLKEQEAPK